MIFLFQTVLTFFGIDSEDGIDLFTLKNLTHFLVGFSWTAISLYSNLENLFLLYFISFLVGSVFVFTFLFLMKQFGKLSEDNSFQISSCIGKIAEVYLTIPENKTGFGKVMLSVNGSFKELDAMTEFEKILTGQKVKIIRIENNTILFVEKI